MALSPEFLQGSIWFMLVAYLIAFGFQLYMLYLNWKQSRVNNQMAELVNEVKEIKNLLKTMKKGK